MYSSHFGLSDEPFRLTPDPKYFFSSLVHRPVAEQLRHALRSPVGIALLTGNAGTGKTTLLRHLMDTCAQKTPVALISNANLSFLDFLSALNNQFQTGAGDARAETQIKALERFVANRVTQEDRPVILVDEADHLRDELLQQLPRLVALRHGDVNALSLLLASRRDLRPRLDPAIFGGQTVEQTQLPALPPKEVPRYILHRLRIAESHREPLFTSEALERIAELSGGVPQKINSLCNKTLLLGALEEETQVHRQLVDEANAEIAAEYASPLRSDSEAPSREPPPPKPRVPAKSREERRGQTMIENLGDALAAKMAAPRSPATKTAQIGTTTDAPPSPAPIRPAPMEAMRAPGQAESPPTEHEKPLPSLGLPPSTPPVEPAERPSPPPPPERPTPAQPHPSAGPPERRTAASSPLAVSPDHPEPPPSNQSSRPAVFAVILSLVVAIGITAASFLPAEQSQYWLAKVRDFLGGLQQTAAEALTRPSPPQQLTPSPTDGGGQRTATAVPAVVEIPTPADSPADAGMDQPNGVPGSSREDTTTASPPAVPDHRLQTLPTPPASPRTIMEVPTSADSPAATGGDTTTAPLPAAPAGQVDMPSSPKAGVDPSPEKAPPPTSAKIQALLKQAKKQQEARKFTIPSGDNAYESYRQVLEIDAENAEAKRGSEAIRNRYLRWARQAEAEGNLLRARRYYRKALFLDPANEELQTAIQRVSKDQ